MNSVPSFSTTSRMPWYFATRVSSSYLRCAYEPRRASRLRARKAASRQVFTIFLPWRSLPLHSAMPGNALVSSLRSVSHAASVGNRSLVLHLYLAGMSFRWGVSWAAILEGPFVLGAG